MHVAHVQSNGRNEVWFVVVMGDDCHCDWTARAWKASLSSSDNTLPPSVSRVSSPLQGRTCRWARTELSRGLLNPESMEWSRRRSAGNGPSPWQAPRKKPAKAQTPAASARLQGQEIPVGHLWASTLEVGSSNEASLVDKPTSQPHTPMPASRCLTASASVPKPEWPLASGRRLDARPLPCGQPTYFPLWDPSGGRGSGGSGHGNHSRIRFGGTPPNRPRRAPPRFFRWPRCSTLSAIPHGLPRRPLPRPLALTGASASWPCVREEPAARRMAPSGSCGPSPAATPHASSLPSWAFYELVSSQT